MNREVMCELARQLVSEVREAVESAAQHGERPPQWAQAFMSPAGWERYHQLCEEAGCCGWAITVSVEPESPIGGSWFYPPNDAHSNRAIKCAVSYLWLKIGYYYLTCPSFLVNWRLEV